MSHGYEPVGITLESVERNAAHGSSHIISAVSCRQRKLQSPRYIERIVKEHLIEVAQTIEKDRITKLILELGILLHHGT